MHLRRLMTSYLGFAVVFAIALGSSHAATPDDLARCHDYAQRSVQQFELAITHSKCRITADQQWHGAAANHFAACLAAPEATAKLGLTYRDSVLAACGANNTPGDSKFDPSIVARTLLAGPHGENGKIVDANNTRYISYTIITPGAAPQPVTLPVFRPVPNPSPDLPQPHLTNDNTGSWMFLGEGVQAQYSALIDLDAKGIVNWSFLPPDVVALYRIPSAQALARTAPARSAEPVVPPQPAISNQPQTPPTRVATTTPAPAPAKPDTATASTFPKLEGKTSLYDVIQEKKLQRLSALPAPNVANHSPSRAAPANATDLSGVWVRSVQAGSPIPAQQIVVVMSGRDFLANSLNDQPHLPAGQLQFTGRIAPDGSMEGRYTAATKDGNVAGYPTRFKRLGPDEIMLTGDRLTPEETALNTYKRVSYDSAGDIACSPQVKSHIDPAEANARGQIENLAQHAANAACWFRIGAEFGYAEAEFNYAAALVFGIGVPKDRPQGVAWLQRAAMHGAPLAADALSREFESGETLPKSRERATYWDSRFAMRDPSIVHTPNFFPVPQVMLDIAPPCDPSNPNKLSAMAALDAGRVAFEARVHDVAACWFRIGDAGGNVRASVYLGVQTMFGWGVKADPDAAIALLKKASRANDAFGTLYAANFYRYGIGVPKDEGLAGALAQQVWTMPNGKDIYDRVQGTVPTDEEYDRLERQAQREADEEQRACFTAKQQGKLPPTSDPRSQRCESTAQDILDRKLIFRNANHTVENKEEILPEILNFVLSSEFKLQYVMQKRGQGK